VDTNADGAFTFLALEQLVQSLPLHLLDELLLECLQVLCTHCITKQRGKDTQPDLCADELAMLRMCSWSVKANMSASQGCALGC